ncbi:hypothetical protein A3Q56_02474 [Intoshia linei]|uniref:Uncharacterized protein n=1 Tax=Intoshia linei TaxID=1819745 RepID=A0A177B630_9BILA|nr:hypothetical protein A3Q56_02474 [Intoshia linei]
MDSEHFDNYEKFYANENKCTDSQRTDIVYSVEDAADPPSGTRKVIKNRLGKLDDIKKWSKDAFTITKQFVFESIGKCAITVDSILEYKMNTILENKRQYTTMLLIIRNTLSLFQRTIKLQRELAVTYENDKTFTPEESSSNHFKTTAIILRDIVLSGEAFFGYFFHY